MQVMSKAFLFVMFGALLSTAACASNSPFVSRSQPHAVLQTGILREAHHLYPVYLYAVNGHLISRRQTTLTMKPGTYVLTFKMANAENLSPTGGYHKPVNLANAPGLTRRLPNYDPKQTKLKIKLKPGMTYFIGAKVVRPPRNWKPVVWKKEKANSSS
jgi:hypothetical protein